MDRLTMLFTQLILQTKVRRTLRRHLLIGRLSFLKVIMLQHRALAIPVRHYAPFYRLHGCILCIECHRLCVGVLVEDRYLFIIMGKNGSDDASYQNGFYILDTYDYTWQEIYWPSWWYAVQKKLSGGAIAGIVVGVVVGVSPKRDT